VLWRGQQSSPSTTTRVGRFLLRGNNLRTRRARCSAEANCRLNPSADRKTVPARGRTVCCRSSDDAGTVHGGKQVRSHRARQARFFHDLLAFRPLGTSRATASKIEIVRTATVSAVGPYHPPQTCSRIQNWIASAFTVVSPGKLLASVNLEQSGVFVLQSAPCHMFAGFHSIVEANIHMRLG